MLDLSVSPETCTSDRRQVTQERRTYAVLSVELVPRNARAIAIHTCALNSNDQVDNGNINLINARLISGHSQGSLVGRIPFLLLIVQRYLRVNVLFGFAYDFHRLLKKVRSVNTKFCASFAIAGFVDSAILTQTTLN